MIFRNNEHVEIVPVEGKGLSLRTRHAFKKDEVILVIAGKVVTYVTDYTIPIDHELRIEPRDPGNEAQYLCHSCEPNAGIKSRTLIVAMRDIQKGEEVTISYAFIGYEYGHERTQDGSTPISFDHTCRCGSVSCSGKLQCYKEMPQVWRTRYREYISEYLLDDNKYPFAPSKTPE